MTCNLQSRVHIFCGSKKEKTPYFSSYMYQQMQTKPDQELVIKSLVLKTSLKSSFDTMKLVV